jgi:PAS domain S-box-containing protein
MIVAAIFPVVQQRPTLEIFSCNTLLLTAVAALAITIALMVHVLRIKKQVARLAQQQLSVKSLKTFRTLKTLETKMQLQEKTLNKAIKELARLGDSHSNHQPENIEGPLGEAFSWLTARLEAIRLEESRQTWLMGRVAEIANIKGNDLSSEAYAEKVICTIVKSLGANQGTFFGMSDDKASLKLLGTCAREKRKSCDTDLEVAIGSGLLGQAILEKEIIYLTDVPKGYVKITSGLGEATPRCIAIVPLIYRGQAFGAMEIASFQVFENHRKDFLKKVSEIIALEIASVTVQSQTKQLLARAQEQAHQLSSQEEELRQSMEEMAATQEEMKRNEIALEGKLREIELERARNQAILESCADGVISFNELGRIEFSNTAAQDILCFVKEEMFNKNIQGLLGILIAKDDHGQLRLVSNTGNEITSRTEVNSKDRFGNELSLLITSARVNVQDKSLFTLFVQKISVDLF